MGRVLVFSIGMLRPHYNTLALPCDLSVRCMHYTHYTCWHSSIAENVEVAPNEQLQNYGCVFTQAICTYSRTRKSVHYIFYSLKL